MTICIEITVDTNDADYNSETSEITKEELDQLRPIFEKIKKFEPYEAKKEANWNHKHDNNFPYGDCCREDLGEKTPEEIYDIDEETMDLLMGFLPHCEYGFHTIKSIKVFEKINEEKIL